MKLRKVLLSVCLAVATTSMADDYAYLTIGQTPNGESSFSVSQISKITFDATNMNIVMIDGQTAQLPLASLDKMFFSESSTGISTMIKDNGQIRLVDGTLHVSAPAGSVITLYNAKGQSVKTISAQGDDTLLNISGMTKGIYIVKVGKQTKKVMNK